MQLDNVRVATRLWAVVLGSLVVLAVCAVVVQLHVGSIFRHTQQQLEALNDNIATVLRWRGVTEVAGIQLVLATANSDEEMVAVYAQDLQASIARSSELQALVEQGASTPAMAQAVQRIVAERRTILDITAKARALRQEGNIAATRAMATQEMVPQSRRYVQAQDDYIKVLEGIKAQQVQEAEATLQLYRWLSAAVILTILLLGAALTAWLVRSIAQPLQEAMGLAEAIGQGDLTRSVHTQRQDELGALLRSLSTMADRLRQVVGQVRTGVQAVASASQEIASGNDDLSSRTEQTAANLEQTAASMEQLTSTVATSSETATQANQLAMNASQAAQRGGEVVSQVVGSMAQITDSSRRISDIIAVIDSIAFQTNILALNAAVEAARAGEQGRGFAVVASEVRSLAGRSAEAAKEIKSLIEASVHSVANGEKQVAQAGQSMAEIVSGVQRVSDLIAEITAATGEQRSGITQVNQAIANLDQMTQQNAALVEQASAAAGAMRDQAQQLAQAVAVFKVDGSATVPPRAQSPHAPVPAAPLRRVAAPAAVKPAPATTAAPAPQGEGPDWETF